MILVTHYAHWMTSPQNPCFIKVVVNRLWKKNIWAGTG